MNERQTFYVADRSNSDSAVRFSKQVFAAEHASPGRRRAAFTFNRTFVSTLSSTISPRGGATSLFVWFMHKIKAFCAWHTTAFICSLSIIIAITNIKTELLIANSLRASNLSAMHKALSFVHDIFHFSFHNYHNRYLPLLASIIISVCVFGSAALAEDEILPPEISPDLEKGWNLIATPCSADPGSDTIDTPDELTYYTWDGSDYAAAETLERGRGYLVNSSSIISISPLCTSLVSAPIEILLASGWNLVGNPYHASVAISDIFAAHEDDIRAIFEYRDNKYVEIEKTDRLEPWRGYWVFSETDFTIKTTEECHLEIRATRTADISSGFVAGPDIQVERNNLLYLHAFEVCGYEDASGEQEITGSVTWSNSNPDAGQLDASVFTATTKGETFISATTDDKSSNTLSISISDTELEQCAALHIVAAPAEYPEAATTGFLVATGEETTAGTPCFECGGEISCTVDATTPGALLFRPGNSSTLGAYCLVGDETDTWIDVSRSSAWFAAGEAIEYEQLQELLSSELDTTEVKAVFHGEREAAISVKTAEAVIGTIAIEHESGAFSCGSEYSSYCEGADYIVRAGQPVTFSVTGAFRTDGEYLACSGAAPAVAEVEMQAADIPAPSWQVASEDTSATTENGTYIAAGAGEYTARADYADVISNEIRVMNMDAEQPWSLAVAPEGPIEMFTGDALPLEALAKFFGDETGTNVTELVEWDVRLSDDAVGALAGNVLNIGDTPGAATVTAAFRGIVSPPLTIDVKKAPVVCEGRFLEAFAVDPASGEITSFPDGKYGLEPGDTRSLRVFEVCANDAGSVRHEITQDIQWAMSATDVVSLDGAALSVITEGVTEITGSMNEEDIASLEIESIDPLLVNCDVKIITTDPENMIACDEKTETACAGAQFLTSTEEALAFAPTWEYIPPEEPYSCRDLHITQEVEITATVLSEELNVSIEDGTVTPAGSGVVTVEFTVGEYAQAEKTVRVLGEEEPMYLALEPSGDIIMHSHEEAPVKVTATYFDGETRDVTGEAQWRLDPIPGADGTTPETAGLDIAVEAGILSIPFEYNGGRGELSAEFGGLATDHAYLHVHDASDIAEVEAYLNEEGDTNTGVAYGEPIKVYLFVHYNICYESSVTGESACIQKAVDVTVDSCAAFDGMEESDCYKKISASKTRSDDWLLNIPEMNYTGEVHGIEITVNGYFNSYTFHIEVATLEQQNTWHSSDYLRVFMYNRLFPSLMRLEPGGDVYAIVGDTIDFHVNAYYLDRDCIMSYSFDCNTMILDLTDEVTHFITTPTSYRMFSNEKQLVIENGISEVTPVINDTGSWYPFFIGAGLKIKGIDRDTALDYSYPAEITAGINETIPLHVEATFMESGLCPYENTEIDESTNLLSYAPIKTLLNSYNYAYPEPPNTCKLSTRDITAELEFSVISTCNACGASVENGVFSAGAEKCRGSILIYRDNENIGEIPFHVSQ